MINDEMCGMVRRYCQGIAVDPDWLANDVINNVGPGGNFLQKAQTVTAVAGLSGNQPLVIGTG